MKGAFEKDINDINDIVTTDSANNMCIKMYQYVFNIQQRYAMMFVFTGLQIYVMPKAGLKKMQ
jgi:hypothetical protein